MKEVKQITQEDVENIIADTAITPSNRWTIKKLFLKPKKIEEPEINWLELKSGLKIFNDEKNHKLIISNDKGKKLDVSLLMPPGMKLFYTKKGMRYDSAYKAVGIIKIINEKDLLYCLYAIGQAWNAYNREVKWEKVDDSKKDSLAWEWALQIAKKLKEQGYVKQDLSKFLKPAVSKLEREKYAKIREVDIKDNGWDNWKEGKAVIKFNNGSKVEMYKDNGWKIVFSKQNGEQLDLQSLVPEGFKLEVSRGMNEFKKDEKIIYGPMISRQQNILIWLHEIGHAQDFVKNKDKFITENKSSEELVDLSVKIERDAWAWAIKKFEELQEQGCIDKSLSKIQILDEAKRCLYGHAQMCWNIPSNEGFINKRMTTDDHPNKLDQFVSW